MAEAGIDRTPPKAVLWDLGGVILRTEDWSARENWEAELELERGELHRLVFEGEQGRLAALGLSNAEQVWSSIGQKFSLSAAGLEQLRGDFWSGDRIDGRLTEIIRSLRPAYKTGLLSNAWPDVRPWLEENWELADAFDVILLSCEVGLVKPDPRIYQLALEELELTPGEVVFIDDFQRNIEGARRAGMQTIWFEDYDQAVEELNRLLGRGAAVRPPRAD
jgi:putative hydrolase of the HAD superfamily